MSRKFKIMSVFLFCFYPFILISQEYIKIASFNIAQFGEGNLHERRKLDDISDMLVEAELDLIAIQEVGVSAKADSQVIRLVRNMNEKLNDDHIEYFYNISPKAGDERYAVIYRSPVVLNDDVKIKWLDQFKDKNKPHLGGKTFYRIPLALNFTAKNFDFYLVNMHLKWGKDDRKKEIGKLRKKIRKSEPHEKDWIFLGDMNRYGGYGKNSKKKAFDQLLRGKYENKYRFPLLEAVTEPHNMFIYKTEKDSHSTTISAENDLYDQIIISKGVFNEFVTTHPEFGKDIGIIAFDMGPDYHEMNDHNQIKFAISDHRPVWIRIRIDLPDDD
ncbi:endonuclease/exonuclease/phosphatase family protein [bacterium]